MPICQQKRMSNSSSRKTSRSTRLNIKILNRNCNSTTKASKAPTSESSTPYTLLKNMLIHTHRNPIKKGRLLLYLLKDHVIDMFDQSPKQCNVTEIRYKRLDQTTKTTYLCKQENTKTKLIN